MPAVRSVIAVTLLAASTAALGGEPPDRLTQAKAQQRYEAGQELLLTDAFAEAAEEFRAAVALDPTLALAHYGLGQASMGLKSYEEAIRAYTRCREAYAEMAAYSVEQGERLNRALEDQIVALKDQKQMIEARIRQARGPNFQLQRSQQRVEQRISQLEHMRQRHDRTAAVPAGVPLALGSAYLRAGRLPEAEREYLAALDGNPRMGEAHNNLAYVYMVTGRLPEAERALKLAEKNGFRVNPQFKEELKQKLQ